MASIAQMTGSLIDSGCKHIIPVRVSFDFHVNRCNVSPEELLRNKMKYSCHKNDLLLAVGTNRYVEGENMYKTNDAYPSVVSTMAFNGNDYDEKLAQMICVAYGMSQSRIERGENGSSTTCPKPPSDADVSNEDKQRYEFMKNMPDFRFMGFSLGLAYAHPNSGDNVVSAIIGGLITVRNGPFHIATGDRVQWIFYFESGCFDDNGRRLDDDPGKAVFDVREKKHRPEYDKLYKEEYVSKMLQGNGVFDYKQFVKNLTSGNTASSTGKIPIAVIKPYFETFGEFYFRPYDKMRVIGKAIGNGRPFDNVDIQLCSQF